MIRKNKKILVCILILFFLYNILPTFAEAIENDEKANAEFGVNSYFNNLNAWINNDEYSVDIIKEEANQKQGWTLGEKLNSYYLMVDVDDNYILSSDRLVEIVIEYYDADNGMFEIQYNSTEAKDKSSEVIYTRGEKVWKRYSFIIDDAKFTNGLNLADFRVGIYVPRYSMFSQSNISIRALEVIKMDKPDVNTHVKAEFDEYFYFENISVVSYGDSGFSAPERNFYAGKYGLTLNPENDELYLAVDISDGVILNKAYNVEVNVGYLDKGYGMFTLQYIKNKIDFDLSMDKESNIYYLGDDIDLKLSVVKGELQQAEVVNLNNTGEWKIHTFYLDDVLIDNSFESNDLRINTYIHSLGQFSPSEITFNKIEVTNICEQSEIQDLVNVEYSLIDLSYDTVLIDDIIEININNNKVEQYGQFYAGYNGLFEVDISTDVLASGEKESKRFPFSVMPKNGQDYPVNDIFGVCTHMGKLWTDIDADIQTDIISNAGIGWIRDEMEWALAETDKGNIKILPEWDEYVNNALKEGIEPVIILSYGNKFYDNGGVPYTEEGIAAYVNYVEGIVTYFNSRVKYFEIWNEFNMEGTIFNPEGRPPENYVRILEEAYKKIKSINSEAIVVGGAIAGTDEKWLNEILEEGAYKYMDALSIHPYCYPNSPEEGTLFERVNKIRNIVAEYGIKIPLWITEIGWTTSENEAGVSQSAAGAYLIRTYTEAIAEGIDKIFWYNLQDKGTDEDDTEHNFGLITNWAAKEVPGTAKSEYLAYNTLTKILAGAEYKQEISNDGIKAFLFKAQNKKIIVIWSENNNEYNVGIQNVSNSVSLYNMFFNFRKIDADDGCIEFEVNGYPIFIEYDDNHEMPDITIN